MYPIGHVSRGGAFVLLFAVGALIVRPTLGFSITQAGRDCPIPPSEESFASLWPHLSFYDPGYEEARDVLEEKVCRAEIRDEVIHFIRRSAECGDLAHQDQLRLAVMLAAVRNHATSQTENGEICRIIASAERHLPDFFAHTLSAAPEYIGLTIEALKIDRDFLAMDPVAGGSRRESCRDWAAWLLRQSTGKDFGTSYERWREWWDREGRLLEFDSTEMKYQEPKASP